MHLPPKNFDNCAPVISTSVKFLENLKLDESSGFQEIRNSLLYLDSLIQQADDDLPDVQDFAQLLFDLSSKLQSEYSNGRLNKNEDSERLIECFQEEVNTLFNSLPSDIANLHNLRLEALAKAKTSELSSLLLGKFKSKATLIPKQLIQALAACALLSLPSDEIQLKSGPEVMARMPESLIQPVQQKVAAQLTPMRSRPRPSVNMVAPTPPPAPQIDIPFKLLKQAAHPVGVIANQAPRMRQRLDFILNTPERRALFDTLRSDSRYRDDIALLGIIESNLDPTAISHSGAMGPLQDMGGLQGAFGDPDTLDSLAQAGLLPTIQNTKYNQIIKLLKRGVDIQRGTLLDFLIVERKNNTDFWKDFLVQQKEFLTDSASATQIADLYLDDLILKAQATLPINDDSLEALNFAVMSYNLGMRHLHTLRRIMNLNGVSTFNTFTVLSFIERNDFKDILRQNNLSNLQNNYKEAQAYLARFIALQEILHNKQTKV